MKTHKTKWRVTEKNIEYTDSRLTTWCGAKASLHLPDGSLQWEQVTCPKCLKFKKTQKSK